MTLLLLVSLVVSGCAPSVSQTEYDAVIAERDEGQAELARLQEICPPSNFESLTELDTWLASNTVSEEAQSIYADAWLRKALRLQQDALAEGYIVSVDYDYDIDTELFSIYCTTVINGTLFFWDPETDEVFEEIGFTTLQ